jgi:hypothetical protein
MQLQPSRMKFRRMAFSLGTIAMELRWNTILLEELRPCLFHLLQWPNHLLISLSTRLNTVRKLSPSPTGQQSHIINPWRTPLKTTKSLWLTATWSQGQRFFRRLSSLETARSGSSMTLMAISLGSNRPSHILLTIR